MDQMTRSKSLGFSPERLARIERHFQEKYVGPGRIPCAQIVNRTGGGLHSNRPLTAGSAGNGGPNPLGREGLSSRDRCGIRV